MFTSVDFVDSISYHEQLDTTAQLDFVKNFRKKDERDLITSQGSYLTYEHSLIDLADFLAGLVQQEFGIKTVRTGLNDMILLQNKEGQLPFFAAITVGNMWNAYEKLKYDFQLSVTSITEITDKIRQAFETKFKRKDAKVKWWYWAGRHGSSSITVSLQDKKEIFSEFYPFLEEDPFTYFERYLNSSASILFLAGAPGTGKTSFLRAMIHKFNLGTYICYDDKVLKDDSMFIDFITSNHTELLILEDAETVVLPRKSDNNQMITRFLNVSDGLIKFPRKKIIFTTNDSNFSNVDEAILRPGRCFDVKEFRSLSWEQAQKAAEKAGLNIPSDSGEYTLAELFNGKAKKRQRLGFS